MTEAAARTTAANRRLIERRRQIIRDRVRRRRRMLGLVLAAAATAWLLVAVSRSSLFGVSDVKVTGADTLGAEAVAAAAGVDLGEPILQVDLAAIRARLEAMPHVAHAAVTRVPPSGLRIDITERHPAAAIASQGRFWLVAADGTVLEPASGRPRGLPYLAGVPSDPATLEAGYRFGAGGAYRNAVTAYTNLDPQLRRLVRGVTAKTVEGLRFTLDGGVELVYGAAERQAAKDAAALLLLRHAKAERKEVRTVDVRAPSTPVLTTTQQTSDRAHGG